MERIYLLAPALVPATYMMSAFVAFCLLTLMGRQPIDSDKRTHSAFFAFFIKYFLWILKPFERAALALRLTPDSLTLLSMVVCIASGAAIATGHLATAGWLYISAGVLDVLDGRLARATGKASQSGAFLDSVSDRWCELFVFSGFAWFLRDTNWLAGVMLAIGGSVMVSYTRARGESLGLTLDGGHMQRAERMTIISIATLVTAWFGAASNTAMYSRHVIGVALTVVGAWSIVTALGRYVRGYRLLRHQEGEAAKTTKGTTLAS